MYHLAGRLGVFAACRGVSRTVPVRHVALCLVLLGIAVFASGTPAQGDWWNAGGVVYDFYQSNTGGRDPNIVSVSAPAEDLFGTYMKNSFGMSGLRNYDNIELNAGGGGFDGDDFPIDPSIAEFLFDMDLVGSGMPRDFITLPGVPGQGDPSQTTYIVVGAAGMLIDPQTGQDDLRLPEFDDEDDEAYLYVSNVVVSDPDSYPWDFGGFADATDDFEFVTALDDANDNLINLNDFGFDAPFQAILIQGRNLEGNSRGFDLLSVQFQDTSLTFERIPEPASAILLGLGAGGLLAWSGLRRRKRR